MMYRGRYLLSDFGIRGALLLILVISLVGIAAAETPVIMGLGDGQSPEPGTFRIPVFLKNAKDIGAVQMDIWTATETDFLTFVSCDAGEISPGSMIDCNYGFRQGSDLGSMYQTNISLATTTGISGSGNFLYVTFKYDSSFEGTKEVRAMIDLAKMFALDGQRIPIVPDEERGNGAVSYYIGSSGSSSSGDLNGDGVVTAVDALMALQMTTGKTQVSKIADIDQNGVVEVKDVLLILQKASLGGTAQVGGGHAGGVMTGPASASISGAAKTGLRR
jgi:Dockerin type I domain